ncbi:MAG TPA: hypothetical protein VK179_05795 [Bacteroidales bacterium]|nr:hypothetical protein [Bacteroidales bacterium]
MASASSATGIITESNLVFDKPASASSATGIITENNQVFDKLRPVIDDW